MTPNVSVVVPTHNRPEMLDRLVRSLLAQDHPSFEIIVVDDASEPPAADRLQPLVAAAPEGQLRVLRVDVNAGPAAARNLGWESARAPLIAFTDDDCIATPSWLQALCDASRADTIIQGRTTADGDIRAAGPWAKSQNIVDVSMRFETCNLLVPRPMLEQLGGFDERFPTACGEDTDLGWRALEAGATVAFAEDAHVEHAIWDRTFREHLHDRRRWAPTALLVKKHPGFRSKLTLGFLYKPAHGVVLVGLPSALVLAFTPLWWLAPVGLAGWTIGYTLKRAERYGVAAAAWRSLQALVSAVWEVYLFARSSIRFRTLLL